MRRFTRIIPLVAVVVSVGASPDPEEAPPDEATLAVLLVVDQLRADLLDRYDSLFVGGLRRLLDEGHRFTNATHDHAMTATAPGHTTLATGVHPSRHGIVGNSWSRLVDGKRQSVYSMEDPDSYIVGYPELPGRSSANITRRGLPDWIAGNDPNSRIVSISRKDRAAIGLAGKTAGEVYWLLPAEGKFVTSEFYRAEYPTWVSNFNQTAMPTIYADSVWESIVPPAAQQLSRPDTSAFESDGKDTAFPHRASARIAGPDSLTATLWRSNLTPLPDRAVISLALEAIDELRLGQRGSLDYLGISLSQTDLVGHNYGPFSREQLDNLLRLDAEMARLFSALDEAVGAGRWVLAMSADHGALEIPEVLAERGIAAGRIAPSELGDLRDYVQGVIDGLGEGDAETGPANGKANGTLNRTGANEDFEAAVGAAFMTHPLVAAVYPFSMVESDVAVDSFQTLFANSHSRTRATATTAWSGVYVRFRPNLILGNYPTGHGSPYYYDRHVPMIFLGGGVRPGVSQDRVATVDMAPTLAWLTGTAAPSDLDGRVLRDIVRD